MKKNRRTKFLINKPLQFRYMAYIGSALLVVSFIALLNLYFGIWGGVLDAFSDEKIQQDLLTASRLAEYDAARLPQASSPSGTLPFFKQAEKLSLRQREIFKEILDRSNRKLTQKLLLLLLLITWGTIYISHKIAGPLYRFEKSLEAWDGGDLRTRIHLRKYDEAQFLADKFNRTLGRLDEKIGRLKSSLEDPALKPEELRRRLQKELSEIKTTAPR